tara:strand:- start:975 stop:1253 length:279 start_codon:yes stop_codon:yes gene_type:complete
MAAELKTNNMTFKMKGFSGFKSPLKLAAPVIAAIIGGTVSAATAGAKGIAAKNKAKKDEEARLKELAIEESKAGTDVLASGEGSKTKLTDEL